MRAVLSVALAVTVAHAMGLQDSWWAAISAFTVMQADFGASLYRGLLRIVGSVCGAALGFVLGPLLADHPVPFVLLLGIAAWAGLFAALVLRHSYAWVLAVVTFVMVMCEALAARPQLAQFALERVANVVVGTLACVIVAALTERRFIASLLGPRRLAPWWPHAGQGSAAVDRRGAARHALYGAIVVALLSAVSFFRELSSFSQAMVTTIAVLIVPLDGDASRAEAFVMQRMVQRVAGCLAAGAIAFALLPLIAGKPLWCQLALGLGVWAGAYLQGGPERLRYAATQFGVAFLMVFVQDSGWTVESGPALQRLGGVFAGITALWLVFHGARLVTRARAGSR